MLSDRVKGSKGAITLLATVLALGGGFEGYQFFKNKTPDVDPQHPYPPSSAIFTYKPVQEIVKNPNGTVTESGTGDAPTIGNDPVIFKAIFYIAKVTSDSVELESPKLSSEQIIKQMPVPRSEFPQDKAFQKLLEEGALVTVPVLVDTEHMTEKNEQPLFALDVHGTQFIGSPGHWGSATVQALIDSKDRHESAMGYFVPGVTPGSPLGK